MRLGISTGIGSLSLKPRDVLVLLAVECQEPSENNMLSMELKIPNTGPRPEIAKNIKDPRRNGATFTKSCHIVKEKTEAVTERVQAHGTENGRAW